MKKGILLINTGSPRSPRPFDVYCYLSEFLNDPRVVDISPLKRWLLVNGIIVPFRFMSSSRSYQKIWKKGGSPLIYWGEVVKKRLQELMGEEFVVEAAMRYGSPSIAEKLKSLHQAVEEIRVIPLFPQYASATTGSVHKEVMRVLSEFAILPKVTLTTQFSIDPLFIEAWCQRLQEYDLDSYDHILFSFHGLPLRQLRKVNCQGSCLSSLTCNNYQENNRFCYKAGCLGTTDKIVKALSIDQEKYSIAFQSRLGREPWMQPYASEKIAELAKRGVKKLLVISPAFVADCLETLYEIGMEYREEFIHQGGEELTLVKSLNDHPLWIQMLKKLAQ